MAYMDMIYAKLDTILEATQDKAELREKLRKLVAREVLKSFQNGIRMKGMVSTWRKQTDQKQG